LGDNRLYEHLFESILEQRLSPGERLSEEALATEFGVSRTIVRKVLQRLASEDVLDIRPHRGASVALTPPELAREYLAARRLIEGELAFLAGERICARDVQVLRQLHARELASLENGERGTGLRLSSELHFAIAGFAGNAPLAEAARRLICRNQLIVSQYERGDSDGCSCTDHAALIDAIASGNPRHAQQVMTTHLDALAKRLNLGQADVTAAPFKRKQA